MELGKRRMLINAFSMGFWGWGCCGCGMFRIWDVANVGCSGCGLFGMQDVQDVGCWGCGMLLMWDV